MAHILAIPFTSKYIGQRNMIFIVIEYNTQHVTFITSLRLDRIDSRNHPTVDVIHLQCTLLSFTVNVWIRYHGGMCAGVSIESDSILWFCWRYCEPKSNLQSVHQSRI